MVGMHKGQILACALAAKAARRMLPNGSAVAEASKTIQGRPKSPVEIAD